MLHFYNWIFCNLFKLYQFYKNRIRQERDLFKEKFILI